MSDVSEPRRPSWRPTTILLAAVIVVVVVGATFWVAGDDAFKLIDASPDTCTVESQTGSVESAAPPSVRQVLSDAPVLEWKQVEPPIDRFYRVSSESVEIRDDGAIIGSELSLDFAVESHGLVEGFIETSDGQVLVRVRDEDRERLLASSNGVDWEELPIPPTIYPRWIAHSHGRWVIEGVALDQDADDDERLGLNRVLTSTNDGSTWDEVPFSLPKSRASSEDFWLSHVVTSRDYIVLVTQDAFATPLSDLPTRLLYAGDADGLEIGFKFSDGLVYAVSTADAFVLVVQSNNADSWQFLASEDGLKWDEVYSVRPSGTSSGGSLASADNHRSAWALIPRIDGQHVLVQLGCRQAASPVALFDLPGPPDRWKSEIDLYAGPAGLASLETLREFEIIDDAPTQLAPDDGTELHLTRVRTVRSVLWSPDGRTWTSQDVSEALGVHDTTTGIELAVGRDFVLASVTPVNGDPVWFVAEVP